VLYSDSASEVSGAEQYILTLNRLNKSLCNLITIVCKLQVYDLLFGAIPLITLFY
jgi:hypothetical protein